MKLAHRCRQKKIALAGVDLSRSLRCKLSSVFPKLFDDVRVDARDLKALQSSRAPLPTVSENR